MQHASLEHADDDLEQQSDRADDADADEYSGVRKKVPASSIMKPSPAWAAISSAATTTAQLTAIEVLMPVKICGIAAGSITLVNNWRWVRPRLVPARSNCSGTDRMPAALASTVKLNDAAKISRIFETSPMPKYRITNGMKAIGGIGRMKPRIGMHIAFIVRL